MPDGEELSREFMVSYHQDAIKTVGTANSGGIFFSGVGLYYFGSKSEALAKLLKLSLLGYTLGIVAFAIAALAFLVFVEKQYLTRGQRWLPFEKIAGQVPFGITVVAGVLSLILWVISTITGIVALFDIKV